MTDDFILRWDPNEEQLLGEDPDTGDKIPVPFGAINPESVSTPALEAESVNTEQASIGNVAATLENGSVEQTFADSTVTEIEYDTVGIEHSEVFEASIDNDEIVVLEAGTYAAYAQIRMDESNDWSTGDDILTRIRMGGDNKNFGTRKIGTGSQVFRCPVTVFELDENDAISAEFRQISGENQTVDSSQTFNYMTVWRVG